MSCMYTLATLCEELTHWKRPWCWEGLEAGGKGDDRGWEGWMASPTRCMWVWVNSGSWRWTGRPGVLRFMGSLRVRHDWASELNWTDVHYKQQYLGLKEEQREHHRSPPDLSLPWSSLLNHSTGDGKPGWNARSWSSITATGIML